MTASQRTEQIAARAVHMIASIEPALDEAIERFARDVPELSQIPARITILRELRSVLEEVVDADNYVLPAEIRSYSELLEIVDVASQDSRGVLADGTILRLLDNDRSDLCVAGLLARLDDIEGTNFSQVYRTGVAALVRHFAAVDGEISPEEYALIERYDPGNIL